MRTFLQQKKLRPLLVILLVWVAMGRSRTSLLHLFPRAEMRETRRFRLSYCC